MIAEGDPAPDFTLRADTGDDVSLSSLRGKPVVLYFYPRDDTPGCTTQACGIRDGWDEFEKRGAVVLGVSPDGVASHVKFKEKYSLPFALLADEDHEVSEAYGTWVEKNMYGKRYLGVDALDLRDRRRRHGGEGHARGEAGHAHHRRSRGTGRARLGDQRARASAPSEATRLSRSAPSGRGARTRRRR